MGKGDVRLRSESGVIIDYSLPLHATIEEQWRNGHMSRVDDDGMPWRDGDEHDLSSAWERRGRETSGDGETAEPVSDPAGGDPDGTEPVRPADNAPLKAWQEYAAALGACSEEEAAGMKRGELIKLCTPPEIDPLIPKE